MASKQIHLTIPGAGYIETRCSTSGVSRVSEMFSKSPLKLVSPISAGHERAALVFTLNHGGGLVAGDQTSVRVDVRDGARLGLLTQGSTKIYKSIPAVAHSAQTLKVSLGTGAALLILPDPVQPFRDSICTQYQDFEIDETDSSLLILDWICEGRSANGEKWSFVEWTSRNEIWSVPATQQAGETVHRKLLLRDSIRLNAQSSLGMQSIAERMRDLSVYGTVVIKGDIFESLGQLFLSQFACLPRVGAKQRASASEMQSSEEAHGVKLSKGATEVIWTATSARNFVVVRFGAKTVEQARNWLREVFIQDGTVQREFGQRCLFCLRNN